MRNSLFNKIRAIKDGCGARCLTLDVNILKALFGTQVGFTSYKTESIVIIFLPNMM